MGNGQARDVERAVQIDLHDFFPVVRIELLDRGGGPGNACVIDQDVQAAQRFHGLPDHFLDIGADGDIAQGGLHPAHFPFQGLQPLNVDIAYEHLGALVGKGLGNGPAYPARTGCDQHTLFIHFLLQ